MRQQLVLGIFVYVALVAGKTTDGNGQVTAKDNVGIHNKQHNNVKDHDDMERSNPVVRVKRVTKELDDGAFWANRGKRRFSDPNAFYLDRQESPLTYEDIFSGAVHEKRQNIEGPFWGNRGKRFEEILPFSLDNYNYLYGTQRDFPLGEYDTIMNRSRREDKEGPFWGNRGKRNDETNIFWGNRGKKSDTGPFWGNRGKKNDESPFWGNRGKRYNPFLEAREEKDGNGPVWENRGKKEDANPFWGMRGKKSVEEPFWGNRGKKNIDEPFWGNRGKKSSADFLLNDIDNLGYKGIAEFDPANDIPEGDILLRSFYRNVILSKIINDFLRRTQEKSLLTKEMKQNGDTNKVSENIKSDITTPIITNDSSDKMLIYASNNV